MGPLASGRAGGCLVSTPAGICWPLRHSPRWPLACCMAIDPARLGISTPPRCNTGHGTGRPCCRLTGGSRASPAATRLAAPPRHKATARHQRSDPAGLPRQLCPSVPPDTRSCPQPCRPMRLADTSPSHCAGQREACPLTIFTASAPQCGTGCRPPCGPSRRHAESGDMAIPRAAHTRGMTLCLQRFSASIGVAYAWQHSPVPKEGASLFLHVDPRSTPKHRVAPPVPLLHMAHPWLGGAPELG